jgi:FecR protein
MAFPLDRYSRFWETASVRFCKPTRSSVLRWALIALGGSSLLGAAAVHAAMPFTQATVTRLQNKVTYGETAAQATRPAKPDDVIKAQTYLLTDTDSRAELKYEDGTLVRIGQNTVFTFEADTRTLSLEKGSLIFHIPKGSGGGTIRTASITAAITGTIGKVSTDTIAILEGEITLLPSGQRVGAGSFAQANSNGTVSVRKFDVMKAGEGKLMKFNGPVPGFDEAKLQKSAASGSAEARPPEPGSFESQDRTQNSPSGLRKFFPDMTTPRPRTFVPPPRRGGGEKPPPY